MLGHDQRRAFHEDGYLYLRGAVPTSAVEQMRERLWRMLEHRGARRDDRTTWTPAAAVGLRGLRKGDIAPHDSPPVVEALDDLIGEGRWRAQRSWGQALVTFPDSASWDVPHRPWHVDHGHQRLGEVIWGVNVFLFVDDVVSHGGGTVVLHRSPGLMATFVDGLRPATRTQKQLHQAFLASDPYLTALADPNDTTDRVARFVECETDVRGVMTRVVELTGRAGDVVICHPWAVHNVAPNARDRPRLMRASRAFHRDLFGASA